MLENAFNALKTYDWGSEPGQLQEIRDAVVTTHGDAAARGQLESQLAAALQAGLPRAAQDFICRQLMQVGTAASVPALATLLANKDLSHMARFALERIQGPEAGQALRDALPKVAPELQVGLLSTLGARAEEADVPLFASMLSDKNPAVARAAAVGLGHIGSSAAAAALAAAKPSDPAATSAAIDASLACAEGLLAAGKKAEALAVYKRFAGSDQPKHVRLAATRGMLACAGKKDA
jgi:HEAT repeat protein